MTCLDRLKNAAREVDSTDLQRRLNETPDVASLSRRLSTLRKGEVEWLYVLPKPVAAR